MTRERQNKTAMGLAEDKIVEAFGLIALTKSAASLHELNEELKRIAQQVIDGWVSIDEELATTETPNQKER